MSTRSTSSTAVPSPQASTLLSPLAGAQRAVRAVVQEHGLLALLLAVAEALYLPWAITAIDWIDNTQLLWPTVLLGLLTGIVLARLWPRDPRGFLVGTVLGWCTLFLAVGRVLPPPGRIFQDLGTILHWILTHGAASPVGGNPIVDVGRSGFTALEVFSGQLASWWRLGGAGEAAVNDRIFLFLLATLCWISTVYLGWALYSRLAPLVSQLPLGAVLVTLVVLGGRGRTEVYLFVATALLLMLRVQVLGLTRRWLERGLDFPSSVAGEIIATGVGFTVLVSVLALIIPAVPQNPLAVRFWELFNAPWSALEHNVGNAFFGVRHQVGGNNGLGLHLGGSLAFGPDQVVFYAATNEAPPPNPSQHDFGNSGYVEPEHYFIGATYATYDGRGWHVGPVAGTSRTGVPLGPNGAPEYLGVSSSSASVVQRPASTPIVSPQPNGSKVVQHIELKSDPGSLLYAYNIPISTDHAYGILQSGGLPNRLTLPPGTTHYTVVSIKPEVTVQELAAASTSYPSWLAPYLAKPNVPDRVVQLAHQWAGDATNPYTKAMNIEAQLRKIPYSTNITPPPPGRDAVDYFLFDLKRGYCEYYASAMVVLLREVGVPARIATGFATTTYNQQRSAYEVTQDDAHTWVQVYFPAYGWLNFEPTPVNPEIVRPSVSLSGSVAFAPQVQPAGATQPTFVLALLRILLLIAGGAVIILIVLAVRLQWERDLSPNDYVRIIYERVVRRTSRGGLEKLPNETALEYGHRIAQVFDVEADDVAEAVQRLVRLYTLSRYSPRQLSAADRLQAAESWRIVRFRLWHLGGRQRRDSSESLAA